MLGDPPIRIGSTYLFDHRQHGRFKGTVEWSNGMNLVKVQVLDGIVISAEVVQVGDVFCLCVNHDNCKWREAQA